jgi:hypothetical protein
VWGGLEREGLTGEREIIEKSKQFFEAIRAAAQIF